MKPQKINVLGTDYTIETLTIIEEPGLEGKDGFDDVFAKRIVIRDTAFDKNFPDTTKALETHHKQILRHELIHAFLFESGLDKNSFGENEELIDWIAIQFPKMLKVFQKVQAI